MHTLGDVLTQEKIKRVLTARRNLYNAGVELLAVSYTHLDVYKRQVMSTGYPAVQYSTSQYCAAMLPSSLIGEYFLKNDLPPVADENLQQMCIRDRI